MALGAYCQNGWSQITSDPVDQVEELCAGSGFPRTIPQDDSIFDLMDFSAAGDPFYYSVTTQHIQHFGPTHQTVPQDPPSRASSPVLPQSTLGFDVPAGSTEQSTTPVTGSKRYNPAQREILDAWISAHQADPYLDANDRERLALSTGLSRQQVSTYFTNYRRRKLPRNQADYIIIESAPAPQNAEGSEHGLDTTLETIQSNSQCSSNYGRDHSAVSREVRPHVDVDERSEVGDSFRWSFESLPSAPVKSKLIDFDCDLLEWYLNGYKPEVCGSPEDSDGQGLCYNNLSQDSSHLCTQETDVMKDCSSSTAGTCGRDAEPRAQLRLSTYRNSTGPSMLDRFLMDTEEKVVAHGNGREVSSTSIEPPSRRRRSLSVTSRRRPRDSRSEASSKASSMKSASSYASLGSRKGRRAYGGISKRKNARPTSRATPASGARPQPPNVVCDQPTEIFCELCGQFFATQYSKRRHLETIHQQSKRHWVCGPVLVNGSLACPICLSSPLHCSHKGLDCWKRPESDRTYYRKDSLTQHLMGMHGLTAPAANLLTRHQSYEHPRRYAGIKAEVEEVGCALLVLKAEIWAYHCIPGFFDPSLLSDSFEICWSVAMGLYFGPAFYIEAFNSPFPVKDVHQLGEDSGMVQLMYGRMISLLGERKGVAD